MSLAILAPKGTGLAENQNYLPALVQGEFVSNFSGYSAISVLDRESLDEQYAELLSGYYDDDAEAGNDLGHLTPTEYIMSGSITKTATGYALQIRITKTADKMTTASYSGTCTFAELDNLTGIRRASLDLLEKMGVTPTERTRTELSDPGEANHVNAQTALAQGITAQQQGTEVAALSYFYQAASFDPSLLEAANRASVVSANITSGNIGADARNDIQWRKDWIDRLTETERYFDSFFKSSTLPYTLFYSTNIEQGNINYETETIALSFEVNLHGSQIWIASIERALQQIYSSLNATNRKNDWGLAQWPQRSVSALAPFGGGSKRFTVITELLNDQNQVIGRLSFDVTGNWNFDFGNRISFNSSEDAYGIQSFNNVKVADITDTLAIRIASVNGTAAQTAAENGVLQIKAISAEEFATSRRFVFEKGSVQGFRAKTDQERSNIAHNTSVLVIPDTLWGEPVTSIGSETFHSLGRRTRNQESISISIPDSVTTIGAGAFSGASYPINIAIGTNIYIETTPNEYKNGHPRYGDDIAEDGLYDIWISFERHYNRVAGKRVGTYTSETSTRPGGLHNNWVIYSTWTYKMQ
jgi:hypothetical protein